MAFEPRIETARLRIGPLAHADAAFILELLNDPDWLRYIGDRRVGDLDAARAWIDNGPRASYNRHGFGLYRVALRDRDRPIGICGLLRRDALPAPDLGFALLPAYRREGYGFEAAQAVLTHEFEHHAPDRICAISSPANLASATLLRKLGFRRKNSYRPEPGGEALDLYFIDNRG